MRIPLITSLIHYFKVVYGYAGRKIYILLLLSLFGGLSECIGISLLLPILDIDKAVSDKGQYTKTIYNLFKSAGIDVSLLSLLIMLLLAMSLKGIFLFLQAIITAYIQYNLVKSIRIGFCHKYKTMKYSYYTNTSIGYLNNIVTTEVSRGVEALNKYIVVLGNLIFILIYIAFAVFINYKMTLLVLVLSIFMFTMLRRLSWISRKLSILVSETNAKIQSLLIQTIDNFKYLKATDSFNYVFKHLFKDIDKNFKYQY